MPQAARLALILGLVLFVLTGCNTNTTRPERAYVVPISVGDGYGSGVIVAPRRILTAKHLPEYSADLYVKFAGKSLPAKVLRMSEKSDLALLEADVNCPCAPLGAELALDEAVTVVGYPLAQYTDQQQTVTEGTYQGIGKEHLAMLTAPIAMGSSGGGVFARGKLVGIAKGIMSGQWGWMAIPVWHMSYVVPLSDIQEFLGDEV